MTQKISKNFWIVLLIFIILSVVYTSYKTLIKKDFIIIEQEE